MKNTLFIGLGRMGRPMSAHIAKHFVTQVHDIFPESVDAAVEATNATPIYDLAQATDVGTVILMLPTSKHVEEILLDGGLLKQLDGGTLVIDMGSSVPASTQNLAAMAAQHGVDYVDAPVSGGISKAASGDLTMLVGGEAEAIQRARPYLEAVGSTVVVVGGSGAGHAAKAINNLVSATNMAVATEAVLRGQAAGIEPQRMIEVLNASTGMSQATQVKFVNHILPGTYASNFAYDLMLKDIGIAMQIEVPEAASTLSNASYRLLSEGRKLLGEQPDHTEIAKVYETLTGTTISKEQA
jgi:3-hydroxyisobutyrate dehydrogenase